MSVAPNPRPQIGQLLMEKYKLRPRDIEDALEEQSESGERLGEILVKRGLISRIDLAGALSSQWNFQPAPAAQPPRTLVSVPTIAPEPPPPPAAQTGPPVVPAVSAADLARRDDRLEQHERVMLGLQTRLNEAHEHLSFGAGRLKASEAAIAELTKSCAALAARVEAQSQEIGELRRAAAEQATRITAAAAAFLG